MTDAEEYTAPLADALVFALELYAERRDERGTEGWVRLLGVVAGVLAYPSWRDMPERVGNDVDVALTYVCIAAGHRTAIAEGDRSTRRRDLAADAESTARRTIRRHLTLEGSDL